MKLDLPLPFAPCISQQSPQHTSSEISRSTGAPSRHPLARRRDIIPVPLAPRLGAERREGNVGAMQTGRDDELDAIIALVMLVAILAFRAEIGQLLFDPIGIIEEIGRAHV